MDKNNLPNNWVLTEIIKIGEVLSGSGFPKKYQGSVTGNYPFFKVGDISRNVKIGETYIEESENRIDENIRRTIKAKILPKNSVVFAKIGEALKLNRRGILNQDSVIDNNVIGIKSDEMILSHKLLFYFLKTLDLSEHSAGNAVPSVRKSTIESIEIPLPPRPEQDRIVAKVDRLMAQVETMQKSMERIPQLLKDFRQQVLTQAVTGKLTEEWRKGKDLNEWRLKQLKEISETRLGKMLDRAKNTGQLVDYLRNINVRWFHIDFSDVEKLKIEKADLHKFTLAQNDILVCEGGEPGRAALWKYDRKNIIFQKALHRVRLFPDVLPEYFLYHLKNDADNSILRQYFTGTTIKHLTGRQFAKYEVNVPPIEEQEVIVKLVENLFNKADLIEEKYKILKGNIDTLPQSILHKAFKGELVEQLPTDGDAKDLLREIEGLKTVKI